ncbi:MAG TPA: GNAT family N-acetyltransferase [Chitinophagaceae bacterium]|nr:GNAT family N-acetyltransferase [Chitinophagaceae bacterium]
MQLNDTKAPPLTITNSVAADVDAIFDLYAAASRLQAAKGAVVWPVFERALVENELLEHRQWKMIAPDGSIACVWATTFSDPMIWEEKNDAPAVYIHRIAVQPGFRGQQLVAGIVAWAREYAALHKKKWIRLDTVGQNEGLIQHYTRCGFQFLGLYRLKNTTGLPAHYQNASVSLFELPL